MPLTLPGNNTDTIGDIIVPAEGVASQLILICLQSNVATLTSNFHVITNNGWMRFMWDRLLWLDDRSAEHGDRNLIEVD